MRSATITRTAHGASVQLLLGPHVVRTYGFYGEDAGKAFGRADQCAHDWREGASWALRLCEEVRSSGVQDEEGQVAES